MKFTRSISASVALSLILAALSACGQPGTPSDTTAGGTETSAPETDAPETNRSEAKDDLPDADLDGYVFRIIGRNVNFVYEYEVGTAEQNGDVVNDAAFNRNQSVEERLNVKIEGIWETTAANITTKVRASVLANEDAYDLVANASYSVGQLTTENLLCDWYDVEPVDFSKPWWASDAIDELTIAGHACLATGDICLSNIGIIMCIFYNKTLGEQYKLENMYEVVNSGRWTYDYFNDMVKGIHRDLDGDGKMDEKDFYGFGNNIGSTLQPFVFSLGGRFTTKDRDGIPQLSMNNEKFIGIFDRIWALHMENEGVLAHTDFKIPREKFAAGEIVFNTGAVYHSATLYRDMTDDFGVLPFPKADEDMERYYTCHDPEVSLLAIPKTVPDLTRTGMVIEALASESYRTVTPAFYETALQVKYSRDEETVQTLDLIREGATFDFAILYGSTSGTPGWKISQCMRELLKANSKDFVSYYTQNETAGKTGFEEIIELYKALG